MQSERIPVANTYSFKQDILRSGRSSTISDLKSDTKAEQNNYRWTYRPVDTPIFDIEKVLKLNLSWLWTVTWI